MEALQSSLPIAEQEAVLSTPTPRRSRVSSIFQQKATKQDDIDADFLKHVAFAAQHGSPLPSAGPHHHTGQTPLTSPSQSAALPAAAQIKEATSPLAEVQPAVTADFTLAKIEQSIAEIEAELGWTSDSAATPAAASSSDVVKSSAVPPSILMSAHADRQHGMYSTSAGTPAATPPQGKRLSFMGESGVPEPGRASIQNITPELAKSESKSGAITKSGGNLEATVSGAASAVRSSTTTADSEHTDGHLVAGDATGLPGKAAMTTDAEGLQSLQYNASLAHLEAAFTQAQEGSTSQQQLTDLDSLTRQSLDSSASKRQLTSVHSMQNESALDSSKKRTVRHSLSGKISTLPAAVPTSSSYSGRYATRQLSGKASPASTDDGVSPRRSLLASPAVSIHGGLPAAVQHPSKPGSIKPPSGVRGDDGPGATLAGAVAVLKSHARPSSVDGAGWHLATGDGLPFSPRGSLVASSGGSRTLRPITSQQEALFDAEGNMLSRNQGQPGAAQTGGKTDIQQGSAPGSKTVSAGAVNAEAGSLPAKQKIPAKHGMMSVVMWPCFCMRSRTTSVEDPYLQGSLRQQFADKEAAAGAHSTLASKGMPTLKAAVKQKQPGSDMGSDVGGRDWDLGTKVHEADSADAADVQLSEAENPGEDGRRLQGAISLAPKHGGLAGSQPHQAPLQEAPEGDSTAGLVSATAPAGAAGPSAQGNEFAFQHGSAEGASKVQPQPENQSSAQTPSHSHEGDAGSQQPAPATDSGASAASVAAGVTQVDDGAGADAAGGQDLGWGNATGSSELGALGMTGRSVSSRSGTRRRKEWEGPQVASPAEVSQSLEDIMLERFPELEPLLLQSSFTNKQAPWRGPKSGHTSHGPSRAHSLGVSREASFAHFRPESRQGQLPTSHLGSLRPSPALPQEHAHAPDMQSGQAAAVHTNWQSDDHPQQAAEGDSMQSQHAASLQSGTQSEQMAGSSSSNLPDGTVQQEGTQQQGVHAAADTTSSSMTVVEAAALAASSAGAIVRVPTSTTLSQADQIALRYQHQVQFQLQQAMGSSTGLSPTQTGRSATNSPTRRSPTRHRPFHLSESNWKRDSAQLGQSGNMAPARSQAASPSRGRAASKSPVRTARSSKASASPAKQPAGLPISPKGRPKGSPSATRQFERQADRQGSHLADGQDHAAGLASSGVMSYGTYGGVSFSSFTPEMPAGSSGKVANEDDDWADDSGKWGELTRPTAPPLAAQTPQPVPQPKQSSISLADISRNAAGTAAAGAWPDASHGREGQKGVAQEARHSYLSLLESLAQEAEFGSPGNSDNDSSPVADQAPKVEQAWKSSHVAGKGAEASSPRHSHRAEGLSELPEASSTFQHDEVEGLLPHEASDAHMQTSAILGGASGGMQVQAAHAAAAAQAGSQLEEEQPSPLALALAALAATAAQKQAEQTGLQQAQPGAAASSKPHTANTDIDEQASNSSASSCDVLASAAAAAAAAGLSRRREEAQLSPVPPPATGPGPAALNHGGQHLGTEAPVITPLGVDFSSLSSAASVEGRADAAGLPLEREAGSSQITQYPQQAQQAQQAQQEGKQQRSSRSGDYGRGPHPSGPSWSGPAEGDARGMDLFKEKQAVNYVGKSARRPRVDPPAKAGRLHGLFAKLRRGGSKEEEELDTSRPASIAAPTPLDSQTEAPHITKSASWIPKAFSRPQPDTGAGSASPAPPPQGRIRFAEEPLLTDSTGQAMTRQEPPLAPAPLPSSKAPRETFTALPSLPVPAPITADPMLAAPVSAGAVKEPAVVVTEGVESGSRSNLVTSSRGSGLLVIHPQFSQDTSMQSSSESGSDGDISEMSVA